MERSAQWNQCAFENPQPLWNDPYGMVAGAFWKSEHAVPAVPLPVVDVAASTFDTPPPTGLRVTWFGHSSILIEIDGANILTDPVLGELAAMSNLDTIFLAPLGIVRR